VNRCHFSKSEMSLRGLDSPILIESQIMRGDARKKRA
jgi:hypothetical protein